MVLGIPLELTVMRLRYHTKVVNVFDIELLAGYLTLRASAAPLKPAT
jgi:hypothetical protein